MILSFFKTFTRFPGFILFYAGFHVSFTCKDSIFF